MKLTNHLGLPDAIVKAVENDPYDPGDCDITVTQLIDSPQIRQLRLKHEDEIVEDASMRIWSLFGQSIHTILERSGTGMREVRLFNSYLVYGRYYKLSGKFDNAIVVDTDQGVVLQEYKTSTTWEAIYGLKQSRTNQLNVLAHLLGANGYTVSGLQVVNLYKDWTPGSIPRRADYPRTPVEVTDVPLWSDKEQLDYICHRLMAHFLRSPYCDAEERWERPGQVVVRKEGRKTAVRRLDTKQEAWRYCIDQGIAGMQNNGDLKLDDGYSIVEEPAQQRRCEINPAGYSYCPVSQFCPQWASMQQEDAA